MCKSPHTDRKLISGSLPQILEKNGGQGQTSSLEANLDMRRMPQGDPGSVRVSQ
jgi:hypothetical protein